MNKGEEYPVDTGSLFWGADAGTWFQRFFTGEFSPLFFRNITVSEAKDCP